MSQGLIGRSPDLDVFVLESIKDRPDRADIPGDSQVGYRFNADPGILVAEPGDQSDDFVGLGVRHEGGDKQGRKEGE